MKIAQNQATKLLSILDSAISLYSKAQDNKVPVQNTSHCKLSEMKAHNIIKMLFNQKWFSRIMKFI